MQNGATNGSLHGFTTVLRKIDRVVNLTLLRIAQAAIVALVVLVTFCVTVRYFNISINVNWAEEIPALLVDLFAFLACTMGVRDHLHVSVGIVYNKLRVEGKARWWMEKFTDVCVLIVGILFITDGGQLALTQYLRGTTMMATGWPRWVQYIGIPVAGLVMSFDSILFLTGVLKQQDTIFSEAKEDPMEFARLLRQQEAEEAVEAADADLPELEREGQIAPTSQEKPPEVKP